MRLALPILLICYPVLEIALFIKAGRAIGVLGVLAIVIGTALLGTALVRRQGFSVATRLSEALERGEAPPGPAFEDGLAVLAAVLLVAPGLATDAIGAALLLPPIRKGIASGVRSYMRAPGPPSDGPRAAPDGGPVIEGEFERIDERDVPVGQRPVSVRKT